MIKLFDYIKLIFGSDEHWDKVSNYDKTKNSFLLNRFMGIKFPIQANLFNMLKTDPVGQAEAWRMVASKFNRVPGFIYTKVKKQETTKAWVPNHEAVAIYMKLNQIGEREFNEAVVFNIEEVKTAINIIETQLINDANK